MPSPACAPDVPQPGSLPNRLSRQPDRFTRVENPASILFPCHLASELYPFLSAQLSVLSIESATGLMPWRKQPKDRTLSCLALTATGSIAGPELHLMFKAAAAARSYGPGLTSGDC